MELDEGSAQPSEASPALRAELRAQVQQLQRIEGLVRAFAEGASTMRNSLQNTALNPHYVRELVSILTCGRCRLHLLHHLLSMCPHLRCVGLTHFLPHAACRLLPCSFANLTRRALCQLSPKEMSSLNVEDMFVQLGDFADQFEHQLTELVVSPLTQYKESIEGAVQQVRPSLRGAACPLVRCACALSSCA